MRALAVVVLALALAPAALASEQHPSQAEVEGELVCPTCHTTLDQSNAPVALRMKQFIRQRIAAGDSKGEIKAQLVSQFGKGVLAAPEQEGFDLLAWVLPIAGLLAGGAVLTLLLWRWTRRPEDELPLLE
ncbi:MAG TPA: cytochrome c-type biogenesis protein [Gaiellaceae bacterium]|nr:cytochrome c-type biogenesis protein [Gaiellaceae bacterium]